MPKLPDLKGQLPFRDRGVNLLRLSDWWGLVLGVLMLSVVWILVRPLAAAVTGPLERTRLFGTAGVAQEGVMPAPAPRRAVLR